MYGRSSCRASCDGVPGVALDAAAAQEAEPLRPLSRRHRCLRCGRGSRRSRAGACPRARARSRRPGRGRRRATGGRYGCAAGEQRQRPGAIVSRSSGRGTIRSTWPWRKFDSARPKSSGRLSRVVCFTTRGPENESSAPGSAMITSPSAAKLAATPPVVGWTSTETKGRPGLAAARRPPRPSLPSASARARPPACGRRRRRRPRRAACAARARGRRRGRTSRPRPTPCCRRGTRSP